MLHFASKYAWHREDDDEVEIEFDSDALQEDLFNSISPAEAAPEPAVVAAVPDAPAMPAAAPKVEMKKKKLNFFGHGKRSRASPVAPKSHTRKLRNVDTNIFAVKLGFLAEPIELATGDPIFCKNCPAMLSAFDKDSLVRDETDEDDSAKLWKCQFCNHENIINLAEEEIPAADALDYVIETVDPAQEQSEDSSSVIFCLDISGSMCVTYEMKGKHKLRGAAREDLQNARSFIDDGSDQWLPGQNRNVTYVSRLQVVQAAIDAQLEAMARDHPQRHVGLVTFNNEITVYGDGSGQPITVTGDKLQNYAQLKQTGEGLALDRRVADSRVELSRRLFSLEESGATALGPALVVANAMATQRPGSQVIICTDGMANVGLGSMDQLGVRDGHDGLAAVEAFYRQVGEDAKAKGVVISVISIQGSEAGIELLGQLAATTGGTIEMVDPLLIHENFASILSVPVVATHVSAKIVVHEGMYVRDESESGEVQKVPHLEKNVGNVTAESELSFEYGFYPAKQAPVAPAAAAADGSSCSSSAASRAAASVEGAKKLPFQIQVHYTKLNGMKCVRAVTHMQEITNDRSQAEQEADVAVLGTYAVQSAAKMARKGDYAGSRFANYLHNDLIQKVAASSTVAEQKSFAQNYAVQNMQFESEMSRVQRSEMEEGSFFDDAEDDEAMEVKKEKSVSRKSKRKDATSHMLWAMTNTTSAKMKK